MNSHRIALQNKFHCTTHTIICWSLTDRIASARLYCFLCCWDHLWCRLILLCIDNAVPSQNCTTTTCISYSNEQSMWIYGNLFIGHLCCKNKLDAKPICRQPTWKLVFPLHVRYFLSWWAQFVLFFLFLLGAIIVEAKIENTGQISASKSIYLGWISNYFKIHVLKCCVLFIILKSFFKET